MAHEDDEEATAKTTAERSAGTHAPLREPAHLIGERYQLGDVFGQGGMGEVVNARDQQIGRDVAIKRMRSDAPSERQMQRFMREARIQGRLEHPAIVPVHELGRGRDGRPYFVMKKLTGTTLSKILDSGTYSMQRLLRALADVCLAIELAHTRGVVHRDVKPDNIMLGDFGEVYVLDWGVAKVIGEEDADLVSGDGEHLATVVGTVIGTPGYMSPEQARGLPDIDARADVYSLGCILFEILAGVRMHPRGQAGVITSREGLDGHPASRAPEREIPPELDALCAHATAAERSARVQTARELGDRIQQFLDGDRDLATRKALSRQHLETARSALARHDRAVAMQSAGRALVFDPTLTEAGQLVTQLTLEPPEELPAELAHEIDEDARRLTGQTLLGTFVAAFAFVLFAPLLLLVELPAWQTIVFLALAFTNLYVQWLSYRRPSGRLMVPSTVLNMGLVAIVSLIGSPFLFGVGAAAVAASGLMTNSISTRLGAVIVYLGVCAGVFLPVFGEILGFLPSSFTFAEGALTFHTPLIASSAIGWVMVSAFALTLIAVGVVMGREPQRAHAAARRRLMIIAWHLRHMLPATAEQAS